MLVMMIMCVGDAAGGDSSCVMWQMVLTAMVMMAMMVM